jgi:small subunit ribosomal protein S6
MKNYLANFILDTRKHQDSMESLFEHIKAGITIAGGEVQDLKDLGTKEFVRVTDRKFPSGSYLQVTFKAAPGGPAAVQERFRLDKVVNRVLIQAI